MHDYILGFVCFVAGAFFVLAVGFISLGRNPLGRPSDERGDFARSINDRPPTESKRQPPAEPEPQPRAEPERPPPWHVTDHHPAWPECDCPSEAFHSKYYPAAGVR
jgi:hypothetical protein